MNHQRKKWQRMPPSEDQVLLGPNATVTKLAEPLPDYSLNQDVEQLGG
jgi:hypothetical protein